MNGALFRERQAKQFPFAQLELNVIVSDLALRPA
jgi:hypothetical protein